MVGFAVLLPLYLALVLVGHEFLPKVVLCIPDPALLLLVHLPVNLIVLCVLFSAFKEVDHHAQIIHTVFSIYSVVFLLLVLFGLMQKETLCTQTVGAQVMFVWSTWVCLWPPKIAGRASLRDRLAYEKGVIREHDKVQHQRIEEGDYEADDVETFIAIDL